MCNTISAEGRLGLIFGQSGRKDADLATDVRICVRAGRLQLYHLRALFVSEYWVLLVSFDNPSISKTQSSRLHVLCKIALDFSIHILEKVK
jgi:hypothetical protein